VSTYIRYAQKGQAYKTETDSAINLVTEVHNTGQGRVTSVIRKDLTFVVF